MEAFWKILQIKSNNGKLADIPEISVNRFVQDITGSIIDAKTFFLTHCDYDILTNLFNSGFLQGLANSGDDSRCLYLHRVAYNFLIYWATTIFVESETREETLPLLEQLVSSKKIRFIEKNTPVNVCSKSSNVLVTALSSGYHAGSIMLLIEKFGIENSKADFRILHTGSCRVNIRDIRLWKALHDPETGKPKKINKIYLDTSFCTKNVTELPARGFVIKQLLERAETKIAVDPEIRFEIMDDLVPGRSPIVTNAHFLRCLFETSSEPIHVSEELAAFYRSIPNFPDLVTTVADADAGSVTHYHCCCGQANDNEYCAKDEEWAYTFEVNEISLQSNFSSRGSEEALRIFNDERNWKNHGYEKTVYENGPTSIRAIYCNNLSRYEQARLMNYFDIAPQNVLPLYSSFGTTVKEMRNLLTEACDVVSGKEEPQEIVDDYPSHFYDCTGAPNYKVECKKEH